MNCNNERWWQTIHLNVMWFGLVRDQISRYYYPSQAHTTHSTPTTKQPRKVRKGGEWMRERELSENDI